MKKFLSLLLSCALLWAVLPVSDAFTDANGTALATHNASWTIVTGAFEINTNGVQHTFAGRGLARWTGETFFNNQWVEGPAGTVGSDGLIGLALRIPTNGDVSGYYVHWSTGGTFLAKLITGTSTPLADTTAPVEGAVMRLETEGTTIRVLKNAVEILSVTDTSLTSGVAGIAAWYGPNTRLSHWEAGDITAGGGRRRVVLVQ